MKGKKQNRKNTREFKLETVTAKNDLPPRREAVFIQPAGDMLKAQVLTV